METQIQGQGVSVSVDMGDKGNLKDIILGNSTEAPETVTVPEVAPVKRGRGRPKGSKNKEKQVSTASTEPTSQPTQAEVDEQVPTTTPLTDKMEADGKDYALEESRKDKMHAEMKKMFGIKENTYDTKSVDDYENQLKMMSNSELGAEMIKRGRVPTSDISRNIVILMDIFKRHCAVNNNKKSQPVQLKSNPEIDKVLKGWGQVRREDGK